ncbi:MAG TPA: ribulose bisphosphate carboxylase small subunit [Acidimicrobiales bacterium]|jgi:ribulose-bisphosphate carboxylase small chain|nr:ribulose bisphosphate carboxylase small subunit [Acidimicrobiales bacterium]
MRITQGTFSFLPDFTADEIKAQVQYAIDNGWALAIEYTDDPHPRNSYWDMWELPMFEISDASAVVHEINECTEAFPNHYVKVVAYDPSPHRQTTGLDFIVNRPAEEPGFALVRTELNDRHMSYNMRSYAADKPHGERYQSNGKGDSGK